MIHQSRRIGLRTALAGLVCMSWTAGAQGQVVVPWIVYTDDQSASACDVVNTENAELVVLADTGELVIVSGSDVILGDTFVEDGFVYFAGDSVGRIDFADDGDGFRTLWWLDLSGHVVSVDGFTGEPSPTDLFPEEFADVPCDAAELWDGCLSHEECFDDNDCTLDACQNGECTYADLHGSACSDGDPCTINDECVVGHCEGDRLFSCCFDDEDCDDGNDCSIDNCNFGICVHSDRDGGGCDDGSECTTADECITGVCVGTVVVDCDDDPVINPPVNIVCGTSSGLTLALTFAGLWLAGLRTSRRIAPTRGGGIRALGDS